MVQEKLLLEPMFEAPQSDITAVHIDEDAVLGQGVVRYSCSQEQEEATSSHNKDTDSLSRTGRTQGNSVAV